MNGTDMSLPVDVPWKRMGVSKDMIDVKGGDVQFPAKWQSSISAFYYEPTNASPDYCNRRITYLKVVCTITNYQISGEDLSVLDQLRKSHSDFYAWQGFEDEIAQAFPCYGALLQIAVHPSDPKVALHDYPYIAAFQPRKREMYETTTESGEAGSQSQGRLNVLKGATSTQTQEHYDIDQGGGGSAAFGLVSWNGQEYSGDVNRSQDESQNVTTRDSSRERRESYSYSTSINQLFTLLQGYHLGTNRAMFFMQPRPHIQDQKFSFIRGLRRLEGVQEFFLIVNRPDSVPGFCVEVALETAHAHVEQAYSPRLIRLSDLYAPGNLNKTAAALGLTPLTPSDPGFWEDKLVGDWYQATPEDKLWAEAWPQLPPELANIGIPNDVGSLLMVIEQVPDIGIEDIALIFEEYESDSGTIFVTGRRLCACVTPAVVADDADGTVDCEKSTEDNISTCDTPQRSAVFQKRYSGRSSSNGKAGGGKKALDHNTLVSDVNEVLWSSLASSARVPYGQMSFLDLDFVLDGLAQLVRVLSRAHPQERLLTEVPGLRSFVESGLGRKSDARTLLDLGGLSTSDVANDLEIDEREAQGVRREILVRALEGLDSREIPRDVARENLIRERFRSRFPSADLKRLEASAGIRSAR
jgi:hypothetical protein